LVIETIQTDALGRDHLSLLKLKGTWRANLQNELAFEVTGREGTPKTITLKGSWKINNNQQIEYVSEDGRDILTFKGYWQLPSAKKLVYILEGSSTSRFEFKVQIESPNLYPKKGEIRFRIGIGARKSRMGETLVLYGEWKFGRNLGLCFEMPYEEGRVRSISFGAEVRFSPQDEINFMLSNEERCPFGAALKFTHRFLKSLDAEAFIRLKKIKDERGIDVGIKVPF
jgi:hypothetical protein